ncbi:phage holin [Virgibacillus profundi]|uniref:Phage holin n=1 Tax=Virgibacillus profundi TaxID=2024555 RepID=A0A2A2IDR9_9BACI|nr:phage holin [Virgibacillus profundi]PAV30151.1 phage holin [Virgibacillus profundi]PXY54323.1 phage holin [Virgibacillus profundi]
MNKQKKGINWKIRFKNPVFYAQILLAVLTPILAYVGLSFADLTTWSSIGDLIQSAYSNPYLLGLIVVSVFNAVNDPSVKGLKDSQTALTYDKPKDNK